ncbi:uro-adherence factor A-like [Argopecten irradians]|uniref:uro-adherence factor A-like n=1 Tax=Argopecten irradians TaxID=31199 RepID=UPI0037234D88
MTSAMDPHVDNKEENMRILFDNNKEDMKENGVNLEKETELLIIEDMPSPMTMETSDFNGRSDETMSPEPDKSDKSQTDTGLGMSEDLTIPLSPLTDDCVSPLMEDNTFPYLEISDNSLLITEEVKSPSDIVDTKEDKDMRNGDSEVTVDSKSPSDSVDNENLEDANKDIRNGNSDTDVVLDCKSPSDNVDIEVDTNRDIGNGISETEVTADSNQENNSADSHSEEDIHDLESSDLHSEIAEESNQSSEINCKEEYEEECENIQTDNADDNPFCETFPENIPSGLPPIMEEVVSNIPPIVEEDETTVPPITEEDASNIVSIKKEVEANAQVITGESAADVPSINLDESTFVKEEEATSNQENRVEKQEDIPLNGLDNNDSDTKDEDLASEKVALIIQEADDSTDFKSQDSSLQEATDLHIKESKVNSLTNDAVPVDSDSSTDLPQTEGSQGSCEQPLTPSSMTTDFISREEVQTLQTDLQQTHSLVKQLQAIILKERVAHSHNVAVLKMRLQQKEQECRSNATRSDKQLGEVIAHLLLLEGQLKKEHSKVQCKMANSEKIIRQQEEDIESLKETNKRLLEAVREAYGRKGKNGVLLLDNLGNDQTGSSESLESPTSKSAPALKSPNKGKWGSMKDKMTRKHRSSLDLTDTDFDVKQGLLMGRQYGSQESLLMIGRKSKELRESRDKKCRSIAGYPDSSLVGLMEVPDENENRLDSFSHSKVLGGGNKSQREQSTNSLQVTMNGMDQTSVGMLSAISMPILSQTDKNSNPVLAKERPKSISSIEHISSHDSRGTPDIPPQTEPQPPKSPGATSNSSFSDSSNPFKNLKTILKRKGSKNKGKKRSVTMADSPSQDFQAAVKKHFEKYDMS